jgi:hypothetical protein
MLGGSNQNNISSQSTKSNKEENNIVQNDMDDDIPF